MQTDVVAPWVEKVCRQVLGEDELSRDDDGCIQTTLEHATAYIRLDDGPADTPRVLVLADLRRGVEASPELLAKMNEANARSPYVRFILVNGTLTALTEVVAESLQPVDLQNALGLVDAAAEHLKELVGIEASPMEGSASSAGRSSGGNTADGLADPSLDLGEPAMPTAADEAPGMAVSADPAAMEIVNRQLGYL